MMAKLQAGGAALYDVVVPPDHRVPALIKLNLLAPLRAANLPNLRHLRNLRNLSFRLGVTQLNQGRQLINHCSIGWWACAKLN